MFRTFTFIALLFTALVVSSQEAPPPVQEPAAKPPPAQPLPAATDNDIAHWLAGLPAEGPALQNFARVPAWKAHAKELDTAWTGSERDRLSKVREWAPTALGEIHTATTPVFYFFSGPDFLYPHALFPNATTYVMCAREPVGVQPDPTRIAPEALGGALASFRRSLSALLEFSFFITKDLRTDVEQPHIHGILPMLELIVARVGARLIEVQPVRCTADGEISTDAKAKGGSQGVRIRLKRPGQPEQTLYYFFGDISNGGLKTHGGVLRFCETLGRGRSLLKAASYLPHESEFTRINEWLLANSDAIVQDPSGIPFRRFSADKWDVRLWGRNAEPIEIFAKYSQKDLHDAVGTAPERHLPFGFGYQHEPARSLLMLAIRKPAN
jgi:hypothetical protein